MTRGAVARLPTGPKPGKPFEVALKPLRRQQPDLPGLELADADPEPLVKPDTTSARRRRVHPTHPAQLGLPLRRVYEVDPLLSPFCGAEMKTVADQLTG